MTKTAIVITDMRLPMVLAALQLKKDQRNAEVILHKTTLVKNDYGNNSNTIFNYIKYYIIKKITKLKVIDIKVYLKEVDKGVMSSLTSITCDSQASPQKYPDIYKDLIDISASAAGTGTFLKDNGYEKVYFFNGRLASASSSIDICNKNKISTYYYEYGTLPYHFTLTKNKIHDINAKASDTIKVYENKSILPISLKAKSIASTNAEKKLNNIFTKNYKSSTNKKYDYCLFLGSPHEFMYLSITKPMSNEELTKKIINKYKGKNGAVRSHPNQTSDPSWKIESKILSEFCKKYEVDYFPADSDINSHELIKNSELIITSGSSISFDATILGKQVEFHGDSLYKNLIEYSLTLPENKNHTATTSELIEISNYIWQYPFHPYLSLILKILGRIDVLITNPPAVGLRKKYIN